MPDYRITGTGKTTAYGDLELTLKLSPLAPQTPALIVETLHTEPTWLRPIAAQMSVPLKGVPLFCDSGVMLRRISDVEDIIKTTDVNYGLPWIVTAARGHYNGYSRWSCESANGAYVIAFRTNNHASLYSTDNAEYIGPLVPNKNHAIGETAEIRWLRDHNDTFIYHFGSKIFQQSVIGGYPNATELLSVASIGATGINANGDCDLDDSDSYWTLKTNDNRIFCINLYSNEILPVTLPGNPSGLDISPDGKWLTVMWPQPLFYRIEELTNTQKHPTPVALPTVSAGHSGWAYLPNGTCVYTYQNNRTDSYCYFDPATGVETKVCSIYTFGTRPNNHSARMPRSKPGWQLISTYSGDTSHPMHNQIFMLELKPEADGPRIWRIGSTQNTYTQGEYFTEAFASINMTGDRVYFGSNWLGAGMLELYSYQLPSDWRDLLKEEVI